MWALKSSIQSLVYMEAWLGFALCFCKFGEGNVRSLIAIYLGISSLCLTMDICTGLCFSGGRYQACEWIDNRLANVCA
jgi:hypothetical protein